MKGGNQIINGEHRLRNIEKRLDDLEKILFSNLPMVPIQNQPTTPTNQSTVPKPVYSKMPLGPKRHSNISPYSPPPLLHSTSSPSQFSTPKKDQVHRNFMLLHHY